jgi:branched-chain amino acid aminotransferase
MMKMVKDKKLVVGADFAGFPLKEAVVAHLKAKGWEYITPRSSAILPSITNDSLMTLAKEIGMKVTRRRICVEELADMQEAAACGTACVISPLTKVVDPDNDVTYSFGDKPGPILTKLYHALQDIQYGRVEDKHGWCTIVE